jgi:hypothetical protein
MVIVLGHIEKTEAESILRGLPMSVCGDRHEHRPERTS